MKHKHDKVAKILKEVALMIRHMAVLGILIGSGCSYICGYENVTFGQEEALPKKVLAFYYP